MNNIVILNALNLSEYAYKNLYNERSAVSFAVEAASLMPDISEKAVIVPSSVDTGAFDGFKQHVADSVSPAKLVKALTDISEGYDNIFYYSADCPLIDTRLTEKMYENHRRYFCEYTFADGYPAGLCVEIIKTSILGMLSKLAEAAEGSAGRNCIFSLIEKDINAFEIETEISPDDQRLLRVALFPDTKRNFIQLKSIANDVLADNTPDKTRAESVLETVRARGEFLRTLPVFFEFETTTAHPQKIEYMPENGGISASGSGEMKPEDFESALGKIAAFSDDAVISLSVRNEPALHSQAAVLAEAVLAHDRFSLLIETSGLGWKQEQLERILEMDSERITWIIDLDALDRELYRSIRGDGYDEAYSFASMMYEKTPSNTWVQVVRMQQNEEDNEHFYKYWKEKTNNVIIQKYDWCCGMLEQRKVTDLSPVKRLPCWHLKREMTVLADGRVPLCRDDLECGLVCGNLFTDDIEAVWKAAGDVYRKHLDEEYPGICRNCDEYYTYNY